jgi:hypothetical protein
MFFLVRTSMNCAGFSSDCERDLQVAEDLGVDANVDHAALESGYKYRLGKEIFVPAAAAGGHLNAVKAGGDETGVQANCA